MYKHLLEAKRALREVEQHHVFMNRRVNRPESDSFTLSKVREALGALAKMEVQEGDTKC